MGRAPCCEKDGVRRGAWSPEEDQRLVAYVRQHGHPNWRALPKQAGLLRCGKSCRLRWINYLRPDIKRGNFSAEEEDLIVRLHRELGNRWSAIAAQLPGRTDNEIKNVWHTHIKKKLKDADSGGRKKQACKTKDATKDDDEAAEVEGDDDAPSPFAAASPALSSSVSSGVTSSTVTESTAAAASADNAATTSASQLVAVKAEETETFSTAEFPPIDESFWTSEDVMDMDLGDMDEELGLASSAATRDEDMEFWLKMLLESGDMRDLSAM